MYFWEALANHSAPQSSSTSLSICTDKQYVQTQICVLERISFTACNLSHAKQSLKPVQNLDRVTEVKT